VVRAVILAPWRGGNKYREASWALLRPYYESLSLPIHEGDSGSQPFSTAQSYNRAAEAAGDWDIGVFINTDCFVPYESLRAGIANAQWSEHLTLPHDRTYLLKRGFVPAPEELTPRLVRGRTTDGLHRKSPAGVVIIPRSIWDRVGGYDEKFLVWGWEDKALLQAVGEFDRLPGPLYHYWHPTRTDKRDAATLDHWRANYWGRPVAEHLIRV